MHIRGKTGFLEPSNQLVYRISPAIIALLPLAILETVYLIVPPGFSNEIFTAISMVAGTILGTFFGKKG